LCWEKIWCEKKLLMRKKNMKRLLKKAKLKIIGLEGKITYIGKFAGYRLKKPIQFDVLYKNNEWFLDNERLEIFGWGRTFEEAEENLKAVFETLVEEYLLESDENLTEGAKELKRMLSEYVDVSCGGKQDGGC